MPIFPVQVTVGEYYFVVTCPNCSTQYAIGPAPLPSVLPVVRAWPDSIDCPAPCDTHTDYQPEQIQRCLAVALTRTAPYGSFHLVSDR